MEPGKKQSESLQGESRTTNHWGAVTPNHYTTSGTAYSWQSDLFLCIASCHELDRMFDNRSSLSVAASIVVVK